MAGVGVVSMGEEEEEPDLVVGVLLSEELDLERSEDKARGGGVPGRSPERGVLLTVTGGLGFFPLPCPRAMVFQRCADDGFNGF